MCPIRDERMDERVADDGGHRVVVAVVGVRGDGVGDPAEGCAERVRRQRRGDPGPEGACRAVSRVVWP
jgi:hypothetical protein